jgi:DNA-binding response OmpR family regulator
MALLPKKLPTRPQILIVEDADDVRTVLSLFFKQEGWNVIATSNLGEALLLTSQSNFDCLLLDVKLGTQNSLAVLQIIPLHNDLPIIFISGLPSEEDRHCALSAGAKGYFSKPFDPRTLLQLADNHFLRPPNPQKFNDKRSSF